ncbi:hypothetical protein GCM10011506_07770 [Marivirga lumbricoides]|uniref:LysM domain-containing protein n=1 Tax=Marivirga lumbricoides TaxID=1046115 RepID=A0ABQ1LL34_9BACT|nr:hypothetical protein GCM10011506_07770 [Marivirga lumbricoides]
MRKISFLFITACIAIQLQAQQVPSRLEFADMELKLTDDAIRDIQADVDAMTRSATYFQKKLQRVDMYMPIIERIFAEEGLPDDFKYLVIQESALISDAVSSSNAVGFWQFKEISGLENGLRIDRVIDERMNIVSSTRAAATYLKSHNKYFDNWAYALIAYQAGLGGAQNLVDEGNFGKKKLTITKNTYWYLKKYLAHKIAYEQALGTSEVQYFLQEKTDAADLHLKDIASEYNVTVELLEEYNKWIKRGRVPSDKTYTVIIPLEGAENIAKYQQRNTARNTSRNLPGNINIAGQDKFPMVEGDYNPSDTKIPHQVEINGKKGILAVRGYTVAKLAEAGGISEKRFRKYNDISSAQGLNYGNIYYLQRKRNRAKFYYHTVKAGETMWEISQKYALKLHKLYRKNRMESPEQPKEGRVLWLRLNRPDDIPIEYKKTSQPAAKPESQIVSEKSKTEAIAPVKNAEAKVTEKAKAEPIQNKVEVVDTVVVSEKASPNLYAESTEQEAKQEEAAETFFQNKQEDINEVENEEMVEEEIEPRQELMIYEIKKGDTFFSIANRFNMRISDLLEFNQLNIRDTLSIGQKISVNKYSGSIENNPLNKETPSSSTQMATNTPSGAIEHKVQAGETMYSLAKKYGVSLKEIMEWNDKSDYSLSTGDVILIKKK